MQNPSWTLVEENVAAEGEAAANASKQAPPVASVYCAGIDRSIGRGVRVGDMAHSAREQRLVS